MAQIVKDLVTWLKQWFYTEDEINTITGGLQTQINNKADSTTVTALTNSVNSKLDSSSYVIDNGLSSSSTNPVQNKVINTALNGKANSSHTHNTTQITDATAYNNLGTNSNDSQSVINNAIDTAIGTLSSIQAIQIVSTLPTASVSTKGKLYIISENNKINIYYTEEDNGTYSWHKMDADILDEFSISWSDITDKPFTSVDSSMSSSSTNPVQNKVINTALNGKSPTNHSSTASTYGLGSTSNYGHNKTINNLTQSSHSNGTSLSAYQGYVLKGLIDDLDTDKEEVSNKVTSLSSSSTDTQYPSAKAVYTGLNGKANSSHTHDERYYTETEINTLLSNKADSSDLSNKSDKTATIGTNITLVDKGDANEGCIIFNTIS